MPGVAVEVAIEGDHLPVVLVRPTSKITVALYARNIYIYIMNIVANMVISVISEVTGSECRVEQYLLMQRTALLSGNLNVISFVIFFLKNYCEEFVPIFLDLKKTFEKN